MEKGWSELAGIRRVPLQWYSSTYAPALAGLASCECPHMALPSGSSRHCTLTMQCSFNLQNDTLLIVVRLRKIAPELALVALNREQQFTPHRAAIGNHGVAFRMRSVP